MLGMINRASGNIHKINIALVKHILKLAEHFAVWKILSNGSAAILDDIARGDNLE